MKTLFSLFLGLIILCPAYTQNDIKLENQFMRLLEEDNFFQIRSLLNSTKEADISPEKRLYFTALSESRFDQCELSNQHIETFLNTYSDTLADSLIVKLLDTQISNYARMYKYKLTAGKCSEILEQYKNSLDSTEIEDYQNSYNLFNTLSNVPPQQAFITQDEIIPAYRNQFNHFMVPVKSNEISTDFIFDTGANLSTISESYAQKFNLRILDSSISISTSTSLKVNSRLAIADSIFVGEILFRNVVFLLLPDEALSFPEINFVINGIIGFPVMHQMSEIHLYKNGTIAVPKEPKDRNLNNMFLDFYTPVISAYTATDTLLFKLDTGANNTELLRNYYNKHTDIIEKQATKATLRRAGGGGFAEGEVYSLPDFNFTIGSKEVYLPTVRGLLDENNFTQDYDGNLGQDVINQFNQMVLNFKYMYLYFE